MKSVKTEARKIYERYCKRFKRASAKKRAARKAAAAAKPGSPEAAVAAVHAAQADAEAAAAKSDFHAAGAGAAAGGDEAAAAGAGTPVKAKKLLFSPVINGKEPTPEGMRLSKALNDVATALPVTPAYQLGAKEKALHDVLGESALNPKLKTPRL